jgi:flagellin
VWRCLHSGSSGPAKSSKFFLKFCSSTPLTYSARRNRLSTEPIHNLATLARRALNETEQVWIKGDIEMAVINTNIASLNAQNNLMKSQNELQTSLQRLSSGLRINSAKDDAAGLQIANRLSSQISGLNVATRNANDGISLAQTAEGAMQESTNILQRMRELALQSANGSNSAADRAALQKEVASLQAEINRISETTAFGGRKILDGTFGTTNFQVGAQANETIGLTLGNTSASSLSETTLNMNGSALNTIAAAASSIPANDVSGSTMTVTGDEGSAQVTVGNAASAADIASAVNNETNNTGVSAEAFNSIKLDNLQNVASGDSLTLAVNGQAYTITTTSSTGLKEIAGAINADSETTGVTATIDSSDPNSIVLTASDGRDITLDITDSAGGDATLDVTRLDQDGSEVGSAVTINAAGNKTTRAVGSVELSTSGQTLSLAGTDTTYFNGASKVTNTVAGIDISTASGAQSAISIIDAAIGQIDGQRADLGAFQNRMESTISNLTNIAENVTAARSRIQDADFAQETANLTRNQILQQAGTSILAQANQLPQQVLSLLQ